jgi:uncharacterized membrane protein YgdD (TMEM256/DUF423 family)
MARMFETLGALLGMTGVALGAFGAHGLEAVLAANGRAATFDTASQYHLIHALALLAIGWLATRIPGRLIHAAGWLLFAGVLIFSGSLYVLAVFDLGVMGAVAPVGGALLIAGWGAAALAAWRGLA